MLDLQEGRFLFAEQELRFVLTFETGVSFFKKSFKWLGL